MTLWIAAGTSLKGARFSGRAYLGDLPLDRYGDLYPESDRALRDWLDGIYPAGERDKLAAMGPVSGALAAQRGPGTR